MLDLTHLNFSEKVTGSMPGVVPKAYHEGVFYKLCNYNADVGFYGYSAQNDVIASRYLDAVGVPCLSYDGGYAKLAFDGKVLETYVSWSKDYRHGAQDVSLESYFSVIGVGSSDRTDKFCKLYPKFSSAMFIADYLVGNRDRHGSNIRLVNGVLGPLFDFNLSLFMPDGGSRLQDIMANNFIGSPSLIDNLSLVTEFLDLQPVVDWEAIFAGTRYPYAQELKDWLDWRFQLYENFQRCLG